MMPGTVARFPPERNGEITRREVLVNTFRLALLRWRMVRGRALPAFGTALLVWLDRWALALQRKRGQR